jgi:hypothetical protein
MSIPLNPPSLGGSLVCLLGVALAAFLVAWAANRFDVERTPYIALLTALTGVITVGYVMWLDLPAAELLTTHWMWGLLVAPICAAPLIVGMRKQPTPHPRSGWSLARAMLWEGAVYGIAEGVLLSVLPVLITWQAIDSLGWSGASDTAAKWALPMVASVAVIAIHHLGYWEYRNRMLIPISLGVGLLSLGYLITASPIAPVLGHVLGHGSGLRRGVEMPPHRRPQSLSDWDRAGSQDRGEHAPTVRV